MDSKLRAMVYIRNNRKRAGILIICLSLFIGVQYGVSFFVHSNVSVSLAAGVDIYENAAVITVMPSALNVDAELYENYNGVLTEEMNDEYEREMYLLADKIRGNEHVRSAYPCTMCTSKLELVIGSWGFAGPLLKAGEIENYLKDMNAELVEGEMPKNPGELLMDKKLVANMDVKVGDEIGGVFKLSGITDSDIYMLTGLPNESIKSSMLKNSIWLITDGTVKDAEAFINELGYTKEQIMVHNDYKHEKEDMENNMLSSYETSMTVITLTLAFILCFCVLVVFVLHIRDRHEEWCLYQSIGFSANNIYLMALRELLICFGSAIVAGTVFATLIVTAGEVFIMIPKGLCAEVFLPETLMKIGCLLLFIFGILQLPIMYAISQTKTVDAIEDDIY